MHMIEEEVKTEAGLNRRELQQTQQGLVGKQQLLVELFPNPTDRPTVRWLDQQCKARVIPFIRLGRLIWFDVPAVRASISLRHTVQPRGVRL
jgi:hypothetical protein